MSGFKAQHQTGRHRPLPAPHSGSYTAQPAGGALRQHCRTLSSQQRRDFNAGHQVVSPAASHAAQLNRV